MYSNKNSKGTSLHLSDLENLRKFLPFPPVHGHLDFLELNWRDEYGTEIYSY